MRAKYGRSMIDMRGSQRRPHFPQTIVASLLGALIAFPGCATPQSESKKSKITKQEELPVQPAAQEDGAPHKQETLAAVEEFLSRTQEYRFPAKGQPNTSVAQAAPTPIASPVASVVNPPVVPQAARDAAYANAQIALGDSTPPATTQAIPAIESVSVRNTPTSADPPLANPKPKVTNGPIELQSTGGNDSLDMLVTSLKEELGKKQDVATEWKLRLLLLSLDRDAEEAAIAEHAAPALKGILPAWSAVSSAIRPVIRNPSQGAEAALERVDALRNLLVAQTDPLVKRVALCRKVVTFGSYEEMAADEFVSGRSIQTIVYAEIENLRTAAEPGGAFETRLSTRLEVLTTDGKSMWQREEPEVIDRCRRPRRDFFVAQRITLPPTLPVGDYILKFTVEDKTSGLIAESSAPFSLLSPVSVAKGQ